MRLDHFQKCWIWTVATVLCLVVGLTNAEKEQPKEVRGYRNVVSSFNCRNKPIISRFPDLTDCSKFIYCVSGSPYPGLCPNGMRFNASTSHCDLRENVPCGSDPEIQTNVGPPPSSTESILASKPPTPQFALNPILPTSTPRLSVLPEPTAIANFKREDINRTISRDSESIENLEFTAKTETTTIPTTTSKPPRLQDSFAFELNCKSDHPCGLYPNTKGDCSVFSECANGAEINKHCNGGQLFDTRSLECMEPDKAECWQEPDSGPLAKSLNDPKICGFHQKPEAISYTNTSGGIILTSPFVTNWGNWQPWGFCPVGSYVTGIYVWRRLLQSGPNTDQAGVVSMRLNCQSPDGTPRGFIQSSAPSAPPETWPTYYTCQGAGVGFRLNSQRNLGPWPNDNLATDNVQLICSCGPPVYKPYELIPGAQNGNRGDWTKEQICRPGQAICALQTQMVEYRERVIGSYDNTGLNNLQVKCCDVPNPAVSCTPLETPLLIRQCQNTLGIYPRRCDFESKVGLTYDYRQLATINFYESIGFSLENSVETLRSNFEANLSNRNPSFEYPWTNPDDRIWQVGNLNETEARALYLDINTKVDLYQIVGICGHYILRTNRYFRNVTDIVSGERVKLYFEV